MSAGPPPEGAIESGESGYVAGVRRVTAAKLADAALDALAAAGRTGTRLDAIAAAAPPRSVLVLSAYRPGSLLPAALPALESGVHDVRHAFAAVGGADPALAAATAITEAEGGKFQNLNRLLAAGGGGADWTLVVDDDVVLPTRFLDRFVGLCERFELDLAQPAQTRRSHAAWRLTRRRARSLLRETRFVEIGPVTAIGARAAAELLPFPDLRFGWGLDAHWAALAVEHGWRLGIADALAVRHESAPVAAGYPRKEALAEARTFLTDRTWLGREESQRTLATHRSAR
jgi:hypothetical protein